MSAPASNKFQDHYAIFNLDPKASSEEIQKAYAKAAQKYHPSNSETGDKDKFESVNIAYEVLSDPDLRRSFDKIKGVDQGGDPKFSGLPFFERMGRGTGLRSALLCVLYDRRRTRPFTPSLSMRHIENILETTEEELTFVMWYLKQRGLVVNDDKSNMQITVEGMDFLESHQPSPELVMPFIKPGGMVEPDQIALEVVPDAAPGLAKLATILAKSEEESVATPRFGARLSNMLKTPAGARQEGT